MILLVDSEGPDQTTDLLRLITAFTVGICLEDTFSHGVAHIHQEKSSASFEKF